MKNIILAFVLLSIQNSVWAKNFDIFSPKKIHSLIGDYPAHGSAAESADFNELHRLQDSRTEAECAEAKVEDNANLKTFFAGPKGPLTAQEADKLNIVVLRHYAEAGVNIMIAKRMYKRPRPYITDKDLKPCAPLESSFAYPSGHAAMSRALAHMLAKVYPERKTAIFRRAEEVAHNRVLGGVHHPTDIEAGKKLGDAIADVVLRHPEFLNEVNTLAK